MDEMPEELQVFFFFGDSGPAYWVNPGSEFGLKLKESWSFDQGFQI